MLESFPIALGIGVLLGYLAALGIGGGSLLILWLTTMLDVPPSTARMINLMFFITAACTVSILRYKHGTLNLRRILPAIIAGCAAAALFSCISMHLDVSKLKQGFGILLVIVGLREIFYRPRNAK